MGLKIKKIINWGMLILAMIVSIHFEIKWLWLILLFFFVFIAVTKIEEILRARDTATDLNNYIKNYWQANNNDSEGKLNQDKELYVQGKSDPVTNLEGLSMPSKPKECEIERPHTKFNYGDYHDGHTKEIWNDINFKVRSEFSSSNKKYYSFKEVEPTSKTKIKYPYLSQNQRKVKILGEAILARTKSKKMAKNILIRQYHFKEDTAKYAVGYEGFIDW